MTNFKCQMSNGKCFLPSAASAFRFPPSAFRLLPSARASCDCSCPCCCVILRSPSKAPFLQPALKRPSPRRVSNEHCCPENFAIFMSVRANRLSRYCECMSEIGYESQHEFELDC